MLTGEIMIAEIWKPIKGYVGSYLISNYGRVKSCNRWIKSNTGHRYVKGNLKSTNIDKKTGYERITLYSNTRRRNLTIHRLVADAFIPNPDSKKCVNHIDGDKQNNYYLNLEWCTHSENNKHSYDIGLKKQSGKSINKKKVYEYNELGYFVAEFESVREAADHYGISEKGISRAARGERNHYKDSIWSYNKKTKRTNKQIEK